MDTSLQVLPTAVAQSILGQAEDRPVVTKVNPVEKTGGGATLPDRTPFVAQVVTARLSGSDYPDQSGEIAPPDRTLRPYDVPMLPSGETNTDADMGSTKPA